MPGDPVQHDASGKVTGVLADKDGQQHVQKARVVASGLQLDREPAPAPQLRLGQVPGRPAAGATWAGTTCGT